MVIKKAICMHEEDAGILFKHMECAPPPPENGACLRAARAALHPRSLAHHASTRSTNPD